jgi:hypothetical protein
MPLRNEHLHDPYRSRGTAAAVVCLFVCLFKVGLECERYGRKRS